MVAPGWGGPWEGPQTPTCPPGSTEGLASVPPHPASPLSYLTLPSPLVSEVTLWLYFQ